MSSAFCFLSFILICGCLTNAADVKARRRRTESASFCSLPSETGPCRAHIPRYFYNTETNSCDMFVYGGCQGNENNFETLQGCLEACVPQCFLNPQPVSWQCLAYIPRYYYNANTQRCERFIYGGCGATANNFETKEECSRVCAPQCFRTVDSGPCEAAMTKYFYNSASDTCEEFAYGGCEGNENNFENRNACLDQCGDICEASPDAGPCRAYYLRYFYNTTSQACETFVYGGCVGNQNNFESEILCNDYCGRRYDFVPH